MQKTGKSVMDFAIKSEEEGAEFYAAASERAGEIKVKTYLSALAEEEKKNALVLQHLKDKIIAKGVSEVFIKPAVDDYLNAVLCSGLIETARQAASDPDRPDTVEDVYKIALRTERSSILLYEAILAGTKDRVLKKALNSMIRDEKNHLVKIASLRADRDNIFAIGRFGCMC
jgi:rubrerythrin